MRISKYIQILCIFAGIIGLSLPSESGKLGILSLGGDTGTAKKLIDTGKLPMLRANPDERAGLIPYYKQRNPNGKVIIGMGGGQSAKYDQDPVVFAQNRWNTHLWPELSKFTAAQKAMIDYVGVSPNMNEPHTVAEAQWWNTYAQTLCPLVANAGFKPLIFTSGVGGVPTDDAVLGAMLPMFRVAHQYGGGWAYHGYTLYYTKDLGVEYWYSLRYRKVYDFFRRQAPDLMTMPVALYEGGVDYMGDPIKDGYAYRGSREQYADWLYWYDQRLMEDPYVVGVALFKIGDNPQSWPSFDLDPMVPWLISYYNTGKPEWPRPPTVLGMTVLGEQTMSEPASQVCNSRAAVIYTEPEEVKPGGAIDVFKQANPNGLVVVGMRSPFPYGSGQSADGAANKHWNAMWRVLGAMTPSQRAKIDFVDPSPGPVSITTTQEAEYFATYTRILREKLSQNGFKSIIATFDPDTLPVDAAGWDLLSSFQNTWRLGGRAGGAIIYQAGVPSYTKSATMAEDGLLKYRKCYAYLLKYKPWLVTTPVIIMLGDGKDMKTVPDSVGLRPRNSLGQFQDWLAWFDSEANKDPDVLGIAPFKVGAPHAYPAADLGALADWFSSYIEEKAGPPLK